MPSKKLLSVLDSEWLPKTGDAKKLLVRFSVADGEHFAKPKQGSSTKEYSLIIVISRNAESQWIQRDRRLAEDRNLEKVLVEFSRSEIAKKIRMGESLPNQETVITSTTYAPPNLDDVDIAPGKLMEIEVQRNIGLRKQ